MSDISFEGATRRSVAISLLLQRLRAAFFALPRAAA
jgi:hypothetical protein